MADPRPPQPPIPKPVVIMSFLTTMTEGTAKNTFYYAPTGTIATVSVLLSLVNSFGAAFFDVMSPLLSAECNVHGAYGRYESTTMDIEAFATTASQAGTIAGDALPIQDCFEVRKLTSKPGRDARGRLFFSGLSEDDVQYGKIKAVRFDSIGDLCGQIAANIVVGDVTLQPRHWSRKISTLYPITQTVPVSRLVSRRDRAKKEPYLPIGV